MKLDLLVKTIVLFFILNTMSMVGFTQIVQSDCSAPGYVEAFYKEDADQITLQTTYTPAPTIFFPSPSPSLYAYQNNQDDVDIPEALSDTILSALIAVYNATSLPQADSVINIYNIHPYETFTMSRLYLAADTTYPWAMNLWNEIAPTGQPFIDSLMVRYAMVSDSAYWLSNSSDLVVRLISDSNYNAPALSLVFELIPEVTYAEMIPALGDGDNITATINLDHVELIYSVGWGDCLAGCIQRRFWKFKVYYDCEVEFMESYGSSNPPYPPLITSIPENSYNSPNAYPNPLESHIKLCNTPENAHYAIFNMMGQELTRGNIDKDGIIDLNFLSPGEFLLRMVSEETSQFIRLVKY
ncbi:MAG: T9SS type A sorting domain-containing protein [Flavobacteriales bacterium]|nr:T9SS type A sorting domain-containing protein [Flavobacteriales bacterium]